MAYCTQEDIALLETSRNLIALTDDGGKGVVDTNIITRAIAYADAKINSYCADLYGDQLPFSPVPDVVRDTSVVLARHWLWSRHKGPPDFLENSKKDAIDWLKMVARGLIALTESTQQDTDSAVQCTHSYSDRTFTVGTPGSDSSVVGTLDRF